MIDASSGKWAGTFNSPAAANRPIWARLTDYDGQRLYAWREVVPQQSGVFVNKDGGLSGGFKGSPAYEVNSLALPINSVVLLRRSYLDPESDWVYEVVSSPPISSGGSISVGDIVDNFLVNNVKLLGYGDTALTTNPVGFVASGAKIPLSVATESISSSALGGSPTAQINWGLPGTLPNTYDIAFGGRHGTYLKQPAFATNNALLPPRTGAWYLCEITLLWLNPRTGTYRIFFHTSNSNGDVQLKDFFISQYDGVVATSMSVVFQPDGYTLVGVAQNSGSTIQVVQSSPAPSSESPRSMTEISLTYLGI